MKPVTNNNLPTIGTITAPFDGDEKSNTFIKKFGCIFAPKPMPPGIEVGANGDCFANAAKLAFKRRDLVYVEGVAKRVERNKMELAYLDERGIQRILAPGSGCYVFLCHAWCVAQDGSVIDPTWGNQGLEYYGVPFQTTFVFSLSRKIGRWTVLDPRWLHLVAEAPHNVWLHPIHSKFAPTAATGGLAGV